MTSTPPSADDALSAPAAAQAGLAARGLADRLEKYLAEKPHQLNWNLTVDTVLEIIALLRAKERT